MSAASLELVSEMDLAEAAGRRTRVVSLTPSPSIDRAYVLGELTPGAVNRASHVEAHIGGNGVNLARDLRAAGNDVVAIVPLNIESVIDLVEDLDMFRVVTVPHATRVNTVVICADGSTTNINQAANPLSELDWRGLYSAAEREVRQMRPEWFVVGGALPRHGAAADPEKLASIAQSSGARLCLDSPGSVVSAWMKRSVVPALISPNLSELQEATHRPIATMGEAVDAASRLIDAGVETVMVSLGEQGAVLVTGEMALWAHTQAAPVVNTTGAGDAALAGLVSRWAGEDFESVALEHALASAVRWGRAAVGTITPSINPADVVFAQVEIEQPNRRLRVA
jgi:1-phosphofructokinase